MVDSPSLKGQTGQTVENQAPPLEGINLYDGDVCLGEAVAACGGAGRSERLGRLGARLGSVEVLDWGRQANRNPPELRTHDRFGARINEVEFHPAWHELMALGMAAEVHARPWNDESAGSHVERSASLFLLAQVESGVCCPLSMTFAGLPTLRRQPELAREWEPRLRARDYDRRSLPAERKTSATLGMALTEKQGGSDLRANVTKAEPRGGGGPGEAYLLTGHKWFFSAPMSDAFLTLAYSPGGLSCFLVPRWLPDGERNRFALVRLKDKLGNRSNASSEIEYQGTWARMVGEEGRGVRSIIDMVQHTRLDSATASAGLMRQALAQAVHHARHRRAFQRRLVEQPLMETLLADLALESEAATWLALRAAEAFDRGRDDPAERAFARVATAVAKFWVCRRAPGFVFEALECLGGNGYIEESILPRLYREAPVNSVWEGCGNVICLDVLRAFAKDRDALDALMAEIGRAKGLDKALDRRIADLGALMAKPAALEPRARGLVESLALVLQAGLLLSRGAPAVAEAFCRSRLAPRDALGYGALPDLPRPAELVERAAPRV